MPQPKKSGFRLASSTSRLAEPQRRREGGSAPVARSAAARARAPPHRYSRTPGHGVSGPRFGRQRRDRGPGPPAAAPRRQRRRDTGREKSATRRNTRPSPRNAPCASSPDPCGPRHSRAFRQASLFIGVRQSSTQLPGGNRPGQIGEDAEVMKHTATAWARWNASARSWRTGAWPWTSSGQRCDALRRTRTGLRHSAR